MINGINIQLTYVDRMILASYCSMLDGLSEYLGDGYEIVLHSLEDCAHSAIKVMNGFHTGRKEGAPITDLALSMLEKLQQDGAGRDITYFSTNKKGEPMKSTTIAIQGENDRIIGLLCINFYLNTTLSDFLSGFIKKPDAPQEAARQENYSTNSQELVEDMVNRIRQEVFANPQIPTHKKNREIIQRLYEKGIYNMKDSVVKTAQVLNMSKNTVYMHLRNLENEK